MGSHLTGEDLDRLRRARLPAEDVLAMTEHLATCEVCRRAGDARRFLSALAPSDHLDRDSQLYPYVEGTLNGAARDEVRAHLAVCDLCREDAADLQDVGVAAGFSRPEPLDGRLKPAVTQKWWIAATGAVAAAIAIAVIVLYAWTPAPAAPRVARIEPAPGPAVPSNPWHEMLRAAVA